MDRNSYVPSAIGDVEVASDGDRWALVFVKDLRHPPERVWSALTDPAELDQWAPFRANRGLGSTGEATLTMVDGATEVPLAAIVTLAEEPALLEYTWGDDTLRWSLTPTDFGTRLTLRHSTEQRPIVPMVAAGWHICLDVMALLIDGEPIGVIRGNEARDFGWQGLNDAYAKMLNIDGD